MNVLKENPELIPKWIISLLPKHEEMQYLELIHKIMTTGKVKDDWTGTGVISLFGSTMRYDLSQSFPCLTTKSLFWWGVAEELLWFLKGDTNSNHLKEKKIHIWDGNGSRQFLDKLGFTSREEGDLGPVYGFQWRHFGSEYKDFNSDYSNQGVDQIKEIINLIKTEPTSRWIILSAWNVADLTKMALPPCHILA